MASFNVVNYSLRANKQIQRMIAFDCIQRYLKSLKIENAVYIGMGSVWFSDFHMAHKSLGIRDMISIESDDIGFARAKFNRPYKTVKVLKGYTHDVLPKIAKEPRYNGRPWVVWLDYDSNLSPDVMTDFRSFPKFAPENSILLVTVNGVDHRYGQPKDRRNHLNKLLGDVVPDQISKEELLGDKFRSTLAAFMLESLNAQCAAVGRYDGFIPSINVRYKDGADMVTVGGIFPNSETKSCSHKLVQKPSWPGFPGDPIRTAPLTPKEHSALLSKLPRRVPLTRATIRAAGFDLDESDIRLFEKYYQLYPTYAQVST